MSTTSPQENPDYVMECLLEAERLEKQAEAEQELISDLLRESRIRVGMTGVDVGCGTGAITRRLARLVEPSGRVYGVDISKQRLHAAEMLADSQGISNIVFLEGDAQKLELPEPVDFSWVRYLLEYFQDPEVIIRAMIEVTKPNGLVLAHDINGWTFSGIDDSLLDRFNTVLARLQQETGLDTLIGQELPGMFADCGLTEIQMYPHQHNFKRGIASPLITSDWQTRLATLRSYSITALGSESEADKFQEDWMSFLRNPQTAMHTNTVFVLGRVPIN